MLLFSNFSGTFLKQSGTYGRVSKWATPHNLWFSCWSEMQIKSMAFFLDGSNWVCLVSMVPVPSETFDQRAAHFWGASLFRDEASFPEQLSIAAMGTAFLILRQLNTGL